MQAKTYAAGYIPLKVGNMTKIMEFCGNFKIFNFFKTVLMLLDWEYHASI